MPAFRRSEHQTGSSTSSPRSALLCQSIAAHSRMAQTDLDCVVSGTEAGPPSLRLAGGVLTADAQLLFRASSSTGDSAEAATSDAAMPAAEADRDAFTSAGP